MSKFQVIVADPPWSFSDRLEMSSVPRGAAANYPLLDIEEIKKLKVSEVADPNGCVLALWVPSSMLQDGLDVMSSWGFDHKQTYIWVKTKKNPLDLLDNFFKSFKTAPTKDNYKHWKSVISRTIKEFPIHNILSFYMGHLFRQTHEICLIGINSTKIYKSLQNKSQRSVSFGENLKHSAKPEHLQDSLEIMFPGVRMLEIFARRKRDGWTTIGNEVCGGEDVRDSLQKLMEALNEDAAA
jgi:N6-adenosine-specific RNA methylase IME4